MRAVHLLFLIGLVCLGRTAAAQPNWTITASQLPGSNDLLSIAYGNGHFVATTFLWPQSGTMWSRDGVTWQYSATVVPAGGRVTFTAGAFYLLTQDGLWRSGDGVTWTHLQTFTLFPGNSHRGDYIAAGDHTLLISNSNPAGTLLFSPDLATVRETAVLPGAGVSGEILDVKAVAYAANRYYVAYWIQRPAITCYVVSTVDGSTWTAVSAFTGNLNDGQLDGGGGRLVGVQGWDSVSTTDGANFTHTSVPAAANSRIMFAGGRFFTASTLLSTTDGITWTSLGTLQLPNMSGLDDIAYGNGRFVAVGSGEARPGGTLSQVDMVAYLDYPGPPTIAVPPAGQAAIEGQPVHVSVTVDKPDGATTYQWYRGSTAIAGATSAELTFAAARPTDAGLYSVRITNALGSITTEPVQIAVTPIAQVSRIINLSVLTTLSGPSDVLTTGFVVGGAGAAGTKRLLVRAAGPSLSQFSVGSPNPDPNLELFAESTLVATNEDWGGGASLSALFDQVGAFPFLAPTSKDAAYAAPAVPLGKSSVWIRGTGGAVGPVIAEVYDTTRTDEITVSTPRLINVSVLKRLASGGSLTAGFYIDGSTPKTVLVRAVGPGLMQLGVNDVVADPRLALFRAGASAPFLNNEDWGGGADLKSTFDAVSAFGLPATSKDAVLRVTLEPGGYSAQATGTTEGMVLVEVYEVP